MVGVFGLLILYTFWYEHYLKSKTIYFIKVPANPSLNINVSGYGEAVYEAEQIALAGYGVKVFCDGKVVYQTKSS